LVMGGFQVLDPAAANSAVRVSTVLSDEGFLDAVSETIRIAGLRLDSAIVKLVWLFRSMLDAGKGGMEVDIQIRTAAEVIRSTTIAAMLIVSTMFGDIKYKKTYYGLKFFITVPSVRYCTPLQTSSMQFAFPKSSTNIHTPRVVYKKRQDK